MRSDESIQDFENSFSKKVQKFTEGMTMMTIMITISLWFGLFALAIAFILGMMVGSGSSRGRNYR
jgi:uncharacterized membrane protein SpoIIM required for sporulation